MKKKVVIICPGRGSYTQESLGYLKNSETVAEWDGVRESLSQVSLTELDQSKTFSPALHLTSENASPLIFACAQNDFLTINHEEFEISAIIGNSMGWYIALGLGGALSFFDSFKVVNTMGSLVKDAPGGQLIYPLVNESWHTDEKKHLLIQSLLEQYPDDIFSSIFLGGYRVLAGTDSGISIAQKFLPKEDIYPLKLSFHGAYHTELMKNISAEAKESISPDLFNSPIIPLIDGRGKIWTEFTSNPTAIYDYTFNHQLLRPYDFTTSLAVALKEFAPDHLILLGPGSQLGGAIGQTLVNLKWQGTSSKKVFTLKQKEKPFLISMAILEQRKMVVKEM